MRTDPLSSAPGLTITDVKTELLSLLPKLRAFAFSLCGRGGAGRADRVDDLVQETIMKALANLHSFVPGSNMTAWLYTILRHEFYTAFRKRRREVQDDDGGYAAKLQSNPEQEGHISFLELRDALDQLPAPHREALILVGAAGYSYEDAAGLCDCATGTMKSRVNRARAKLSVLLGGTEAFMKLDESEPVLASDHDFAPNAVAHSAAELFAAIA